MAYAALVSLEQTVHQILNDYQYTPSPHHRKQIIYLDKYVVLLQAFLEDFPEKARNLEGRIRDVANDAEDIVENFMIEQVRKHHEFIKWIARIKFEHQLKRVTDQMDLMAAEVVEMKNNIMVHDNEQGDSPSSGSLSRLAPMAKNDMVGLDEDLLEIKERLCRGSQQRQVLPVVGMGGIGKTTLARNAYGDQLIIEHFQIRAWVTVSQNYRERQILSGLLDSMKEFIPEMQEESTDKKAKVVYKSLKSMSNDKMAEIVYKSLKGRRYLIVMDDMWSTEAWDDIKMLFPDDINGSRIMLTTRLSDVAAYPDLSSPLHEMKLLDADQSWDLLWQKVESIPREFEYVGKHIARSCRGLPLAIVVIAGLLTKTTASWWEIARDINSTIAANDKRTENILSLSYHHLPHHLRPCFLYMAGFPEDEEIRVSKLSKLWIAEGFLKRSNGSKSFEEGAEEYLEDLVKRSLVMVTKRKHNGKIKSCSLHDLMRDMCIRLSKEEKFLLHVKGKNAQKVILDNIKTCRRVSIGKSDSYSLAKICSSNLRTMIFFEFVQSPYGTFRLLRVLHVLECAFELDFHHIFELFHLRYLAFQHFRATIPATISNLQSLQTLIIQSLSLDLPVEIWRMPKLRHLFLPRVKNLSLPGFDFAGKATFALENLQTFKVELSDNFGHSEESLLKRIRNIKVLQLTYPINGNSQFFHLARLHHLEKLKLTCSSWTHPILNAVFPSSLKELTLDNWKVPQKILSVLPNLEVLQLIDIIWKNSTWETTEGEFPKLKFLKIKLQNLKTWKTDESSHFPQLKCILLDSCLYLDQIPDAIGEISTLEMIEIKDCSESVVDSAERIREIQQNYGNEAFQVHCLGKRWETEGDASS